MIGNGEKQSYFSTYLLVFEDQSTYIGITDRTNDRIEEHKRDGKKIEEVVWSMPVQRTRHEAEGVEKVLMRALSAAGYVVTNKKGMPLAAEVINAAQPDEKTVTELVQQGQRYAETRKLRRWSDLELAVINRFAERQIGWMPSKGEFAMLTDHSYKGERPAHPPSIKEWLALGRKAIENDIGFLRNALSIATPVQDWSAITDEQLYGRFYSINHYRNECQWIKPELNEVLLAAERIIGEAMTMFTRR